MKKNEGYTLSKIREYALRQLKSWETLETMIMVVLVIYMIYLLSSHTITLFNGTLFVFFAGVTAFGLKETVPAVRMFLNPFHSRAFRMQISDAEKQKICDEIDQEEASGYHAELPDLVAFKEYLILTGKQDIEVLKWDDIVRLEKKEYPSRKKYMGIFYMYFIDKNGNKHELDIHNGNIYNPVKQVSQIFMYVKDNYPHIEVVMSEQDQIRIDEMLVEQSSGNRLWKSTKTL